MGKEQKKYKEKEKKLEIPSVTNASDFPFTNIWLPKTFKSEELRENKRRPTINAKHYWSQADRAEQEVIYIKRDEKWFLRLFRALNQDSVNRDGDDRRPVSADSNEFTVTKQATVVSYNSRNAL